VAGAGLAGGLAVAGERALDGGGEEAGEQRVRAVRPRAELRVELRADHPGVVADLTRPACLSLRLPGGSLLRRSGRLSSNIAPAPFTCGHQNPHFPGQDTPLTGRTCAVSSAWPSQWFT